MSEQPQTPGDTAPLEYRTPPPPWTPGGALGAARGFICGMFLMLAAGCPVVIWQKPYVAATSLTGPRVIRPSTTEAGVFFLLVVIGATCGAVVLRRKSPRSVFYLGMLIGIGAMALCEGFCFVAV